MLYISKKVLYYSLLVIGSITLINVLIGYWFPIHFPLSSFLAIGVMYASYFLKAYYLVTISIFFCLLMIFSAIAISKEKIALPIVLLVYSLVNLLCVTYSFLVAWVGDKHFMSGQAVQVVISITIVFFILIYLINLSRAKNRGRFA